MGEEEQQTTYETYKCPICKAEFSTPEELRQHRMDMHKGQSQNHEAKIDASH